MEKLPNNKNIKRQISKDKFQKTNLEKQLIPKSQWRQSATIAKE